MLPNDITEQYKASFHRFYKALEKERTDRKKLSKAQKEFLLWEEWFKEDPNGTKEVFLQCLTHDNEVRDVARWYASWKEAFQQPWIPQTLYAINAESCIEGIKSAKAFLSPQYCLYFRHWAEYSNEPELITLAKEFEFWKGMDEALEKDMQQYDEMLKTTSLEALLIHGGLFVEWWAHSGKHSVEDFQSSLNDLIIVMEAVIDRKWSLHPEGIPDMAKQVGFSKPLDGQQFNILAFELIAHAYQNPASEYYWMQLFNCHSDVEDFKYAFELYCFLGYRMEFRSEGDVFLKPLDQEGYYQWKHNGEKPTYHFQCMQYRFKWEDGFWGEKHDDIFSEEGRKERTHRQVAEDEKIWSNLYFYVNQGLPLEVALPNGEILDIFLMIRLLSNCDGDANWGWLQRMKQRIHKQGWKDNQNPYTFSYEIMVERNVEEKVWGSPAGAFDIPYHFQKLKEHLQVKEDAKLHTLLKVLEIPLTEPKKGHEVDLLYRPFLRLGNLHFWLRSCIREMPPAITVMNWLLDNQWNKLPVDLLEKKNKADKIFDHKGFSASREERLGQLFRHNGFSAKVGYYHGSLHKPNMNNLGDVDVLAYKEGHLFVIQMKETHLRFLPEDILKHREAIEHGARQLDRDLARMEQHWEEYQELLSIPESFEELNIVPLVVSSSFELEAPDYRVLGRYRKVSMFELEVILTNSLAQVYFRDLESDILGENGGHPPDWMLKEPSLEGSALNAHEFEAKTQALLEKYKLYPYTTRCSAEVLVNCIEKGTVWEPLQQRGYMPYSNTVTTWGYSLEFIR